MPNLSDLLAEIEQRVISIRAEQADWLCGKGCDACCKRLAEIPRLTEAEWTLLYQGLLQLPTDQWQLIRSRVAALASHTSGLVVCPLLDHATGACPVYPCRPVACRTYGFYQQGAFGLYCQEIEALVTKGALASVIWGNHGAVDQRLAHLGEVRSLVDWFATLESA